MDRRPTRFPPRARIRPARPGNESNPSSAKVFASESAKNEEADRKDDLVERDADGNYIIIAPDISISPTKIPEVDVWTDEDPEVEEKQERDAALIELYGKQKSKLDPDVLTEVKAALNVSLKATLDSLEEDKWIFEGDAKSKPAN